MINRKRKACFVKDCKSVVSGEMNICRRMNSKRNEFDVIDIEEEYDSEYFKIINEKSDIFSQSNSYFINEIFLNHYISGSSIYEKVLNKYKIEFVTIKYWDENLLYLIDTCRNNGIKVRFNFYYILYVIKSLFNILFAMINTGIYSLIVFIIPFILKRGNSDYSSNNPFALIHSMASLSKIQNTIYNNTVFFYDPIAVKVDDDDEFISIYRVLNNLKKIKNLFFIPFKSFQYILDIYANSAKYVGRFSTSKILVYYSKRVSHFSLLEKCLEVIFTRSNAELFYSGEKESRQGVLEMRFGKKHKIKSICIPHGLEFSYKFPHGIFGDVFYCSNQYTANYLNNLYGLNKFLFNEEIVTKMFSKNYLNDEKKIVYFTETRNIEVNILIIQFLSNFLENVYIKLHPTDTENNYTGIKNITFIKDFDHAISNNICIARKSTILIEASHNNSFPLAVLVNKKDRFSYENLFPALNTPEITKVYDFDSLEKKINQIKLDW